MQEELTRSRHFRRRLVWSHMTAKMEVKAVKIDPSLMKPEEREIVEDLVVTRARRHTRARRKRRCRRRCSGCTSALGLPAGDARGAWFMTYARGCRSRNRTPDPVAGTPAGARPALGAVTAALHLMQEAGGTDDAAVGGMQVAIDKSRSARPAGNIDTQNPARCTNRARSLHYRRGRRCRRSLGAGARESVQSVAHVLGATLSPLNRRRSQDHHHRRAGQACPVDSDVNEIVLAVECDTWMGGEATTTASPICCRKPMSR